MSSNEELESCLFQLPQCSCTEPDQGKPSSAHQTPSFSLCTRVDFFQVIFSGLFTPIFGILCFHLSKLLWLWFSILTQIDWTYVRSSYIYVIYWDFELFAYNMIVFWLGWFFCDGGGFFGLFLKFVLGLEFVVLSVLGEFKNLQDLNICECQGCNIRTTNYFYKL